MFLWREGGLRGVLSIDNRSFSDEGDMLRFTVRVVSDIAPALGSTGRLQKKEQGCNANKKLTKCSALKAVTDMHVNWFCSDGSRLIILLCICTLLLIELFYYEQYKRLCLVFVVVFVHAMEKWKR